MTAKPGYRQTSWNAGELSPDAAKATHLKAYYQGAAAMARARPIPQGGFTRMPGSRLRARTGLPAGAAIRLAPFTYGEGAAFMTLLSDAALRIYSAQTFALLDTLAAPWGASAVRDVSTPQRRDVMQMLHPDVAPHQLTRLPAGAWSLAPTVWTNIPDVDYGGVYTSTAEKWSVYVSWPVDNFDFATQTLEFTVSGETTAGVAMTNGAFASALPAIQAALEALPSIEPGVVVAAGTGPLPPDGMYDFTIEFAGTGNSGSNYDVSGRVVSSPNVAVQASRTTRGKKGGEPIMSATRGWPSTGLWHQDRFVVAGFRSNPDAFLASRKGEYFDLNTEAQTADGAILERMDLDRDERIVHIARARHLVFVTSRSEWHLADAALVRGQPQKLVRSSAVGVHPRVPPIEQEQSLLFVNRDGTIVYASTYADPAQAYVPTPISLMSSHLIDDVTAAALQRGSTATDADRLWLVAAGGALHCGHLLRDQDVIGFTPWTPTGVVRDVAVDGNNVVWIAVERAGEIWIETLEDALLFDGATTTTLPAPGRVVPAPDHEGLTVWSLADAGWIDGPFVVTGGAFTLPYDASTVTFGAWAPTVVSPMGLVREIADRQTLRRKQRVHTLRIDVADTTSLAVAANGGPAQDVPLGRFGDPADAPAPARDGLVVVTGLAGWTDDTQAVLTQMRPGRLTVRALTMEARL